MVSDIDAVRVAAQNRKARYNYSIEDSLEVGIVLHGSEVKSLREGRATISESYATEQGGELFLINSYIVFNWFRFYNIYLRSCYLNF